MCYIDSVKSYIHARLGKSERAMLERLKKTTGHTESELVRRGLHLVSETVGRSASALHLAGKSVGKFKKGPRDLSISKKHMSGFGE